MAGVARAEAKMSLSGPLGTTSPLDVIFNLAVTKWTGPFTVTVATGVTAQAIIVIGTQGITTVKVALFSSDQQLTIGYNQSTTLIQLTANGVHLLGGTSLTTIYITNASGNTANFSYFIAGD